MDFNFTRMSTITLLMLLNLSSQSSFAANQLPNHFNKNEGEAPKTNPWFGPPSLKTLFTERNPKFSLQLGWFDATQGHSQDININSLIGDNFFSVNQSHHSNGLVGIGYYFEGQDLYSFNMNYGLNAMYLAKTPVSGTVLQEQLFENLAYHYSITHWPIYFAAKAIHQQGFHENIHVVFDGGIGLNVLQTNHFGETSLDGITIPDNIFSGQTTTAFSAMVGVGLRFNNMFGKAPLECGYRFLYLGQSNLKALTNQVLNPLSTGQSYANAVMCSITV